MSNAYLKYYDQSRLVLRTGHDTLYVINDSQATPEDNENLYFYFQHYDQAYEFLKSRNIDYKTNVVKNTAVTHQSQQQPPSWLQNNRSSDGPIQKSKRMINQGSQHNSLTLAKRRERNIDSLGKLAELLVGRKVIVQKKQQPASTVKPKAKKLQQPKKPFLKTEAKPEDFNPLYRGIPIFPVRYAVMPSDKKGCYYPEGNNLSNNFEASLTHSQYCLRNLRDAGYVYLYDPAAPKPWVSYYYSSSRGFIKLSVETSTGNVKPVDNIAKRCIVVDNTNHSPTTVYLCYTDTPLSARKLGDLASGTNIEEVMQSIDLTAWDKVTKQQWYAKKDMLPKDAAPKIPHTFHVDDLEHLILDYCKTLTTAWSEENANMFPAHNIRTGLTSANPVAHLCVALYDGVGIASELSHLVGYEISRLNDYTKENAHKSWTAETIDKLLKPHMKLASKKAKFRDGVKNITLEGYVKNSQYGPGRLKLENELEKVKKQAGINKRSEFTSYLRLEELEAFKKTTQQKLDEMQQAIKDAANDHITWLKYSGSGSLGHARLSYDAIDVDGYIGLRAALARSIMALPATEEGLAYGKKILGAMYEKSESTPDTKGAIHEFYFGNPEISDYMDLPKILAFFTDQGASKRIAALTTLVAKYHVDELSKTLSLTIAAMIPIDVDLTEQHMTVTPFIRHLTMLEALEGVAVRRKILPLHELIDEIDQERAEPKQGRHFVPTTNLVRMRSLVSMYYTDDLPDKLTAKQQYEKSQTLDKPQLLHNFKIIVGGAGPLLGAISTLKAIDKLNTDDRNVLVNSLSVASSGLGTTAAGETLRQTYIEKRASLATSIEKVEQFGKIAHTAIKNSLLLVAGAAIIIAAKNAILASKSTGKASMAAYTTASAIQVGIFSLATYSFLIEVADDNIVAKRALSKVNSVPVLGKGLRLLGPKAMIAILIAESLVYFLEKYAEAHALDKVKEWLEQSIWGNLRNKDWDMTKERYELNNLFMEPTIDDISFLPITNTWRVTLPGYRSQVGRFTLHTGGKDITDSAKIEETTTGAIVEVLGMDTHWIKKGFVVNYWPDKKHQPTIKYTARD